MNKRQAKKKYFGRVKKLKFRKIGRWERWPKLTESEQKQLDDIAELFILADIKDKTPPCADKWSKIFGDLGLEFKVILPEGKEWYLTDEPCEKQFYKVGNRHLIKIWGKR